MIKERIKHFTDEENKHRNAYLEGVIDGIEMYAIWKKGTQVVGCMEKPLKEVIAEYEELKR